MSLKMLKRRNITSIIFVGVAWICTVDSAYSVTEKFQQKGKLELVTSQFVLDGYYFYPISATFNGLSEYNNRYTPIYSNDNQTLKKQYLIRYQKMLAEINRSELNDEDRITFDVFKRNLDLGLERLSYPEYLLSLNPVSGAHLHFAMLGSGESAQPFNTEQDYGNFVQRSKGFADWVDSQIAVLRIASADNMLMPKAIVDAVIAQLKEQLVNDVTKSVFYKPLLQIPEALSDSDKQNLRKDYVAAIEQVIIPSYRKLHDFLQNDYIVSENNGAIGLSRLSGHELWYDFYIKEHTTTTMSAEELHKLGLGIVQSNTKRLDELKSVLGFSGSREEFFNFLRTDKKFYFNSEQEALTAYNQVAEQANQRVQQAFNVLPTYQYQVAPVPEFAAQHAPKATYRPPAPDFSRPGILYINTSDLKMQPRYSVETVSLHEASPGHHLQHLAILENTALSDYRKSLSVSAFDEGWGLYAESLGAELGFYKEPMMLLGRVLADQQRAIRLVADTGINAKGWSHKKTVDFMLANSAISQQEAESEVFRFISHPGQALAYKVGEIQLRALRSRAESKLGNAFDLKAFHREVLRHGSIPLNILSSEINKWILKQLVVKGVDLYLAEELVLELSEQQQKLLINTINDVVREVKSQLPNFPDNLKLSVNLVARDLESVSGVSGIAETHQSLTLDISETYSKGFDEAIVKGVRSTLYHELHHVIHGWTMQGNKFGPGIAIAAVNEGLASVFAEQQSGVTEQWSFYPDNVLEWVNEILSLPVNAPYEVWMMGNHPDGRHNIGYRAGRFIVHQAIEKTGRTVTELSSLSPYEVLHLAGLISQHAPSLECLADTHMKSQRTDLASEFYKKAIAVSSGNDSEMVGKIKKKLKLIESPVVLSEKQLARVIGSYSSEQFNLKVFKDDVTGQLKVQMSGKPAFDFYPESAEVFFIYEADIVFTFTAPSEKNQAKVTVRMFGREMVLEKDV
ncbi:DUF885 family protein [Shewanella zhangzhouensis]|uniref:DUF885 family protein n=1 Tax=Shewanella zhangzhouensis TaxID=2864213 RepID=UPI001C65A793|nr:DUF885 family protein [Shewanella zhangzhouensis]QYK05845.1 DUF885 family protein [Shewanella zhangzhouensis]